MTMTDTQISEFISLSCDHISDAELDFDLSEIEVESFNYSYGSIVDVSLEGTPLIDNDVLVTTHQKLAAAINDLTSETQPSWYLDTSIQDTIKRIVFNCVTHHLSNKAVISSTPPATFNLLSNAELSKTIAAMVTANLKILNERR